MIFYHFTDIWCIDDIMAEGLKPAFNDDAYIQPKKGRLADHARRSTRNVEKSEGSSHHSRDTLDRSTAGALGGLVA